MCIVPDDILIIFLVYSSFSPKWINNGLYVFNVVSVYPKTPSSLLPMPYTSLLDVNIKVCSFPQLIDSAYILYNLDIFVGSGIEFWLKLLRFGRPHW